MKIYNYRYGEPCRFADGVTFGERGAVLVLGFFDGVHVAHRELIRQGREVADGLGVPLGIFTFPSDGSVKKGAPRIYGDKEKLGIFESLGVDFTLLADFHSLHSLSPEEFVSRVLISDLAAAVCVAGYNFRFGRNASGDAQMLSALMAAHGREAIIKEELSDGGAGISASRIRTLLTDGSIKEANRLLGEPYSITGSVTHGNATGRRLGYPTVNLPLKEGSAVPRRGVYKSSAVIDGKAYSSLTNIGSCPTFEEREVHAESYLLDFSGDLYGKTVRIILHDFLRDERKFGSPEELTMQINVDINSIKREDF